MKNRLMITISLLIMVAGISSRSIESKSEEFYAFSEKYHIPNVLVACFSKEAVGNLKGDMDIDLKDGIVHTNIDSFNKLAREYEITDLEQIHPFVGDAEWNNKGTYLQNIYRLTLKSNKNIEKALAAVTEDENIVWAEYEARTFLLYTPNDPDFHQQHHHPVIQTPQAWDYVRGSDEVIVAITDTGTKWNHPDLADNIWINEAELPGVTINWETGQVLGGDGQDNSGSGKIDDVIGWDFVERNNNPYQNYPGNSHGTHVAGIVGAVGDNEIGITGVAMNVSLLNCKGAPSNAPSQGVARAYDQIRYAADSGAHIINCSWISYTNQGNHPNNIVTYATNQGALVVAGAGNDNVEHTPSFQAYPADARDALSVAATTNADRKANFSDYGEPTGISAPGVNILSTWRNNGYHTTSGTSMASPVVAGVAALVKSLHPEMAPLELRNRLQYTADFIDDLNPNYEGLLGAGRVNAFRATMYDKIPNLSLTNYGISEHDGDGDGVPNPGEEVAVTVEVFNEMLWSSANDVTATLSTEASGVQLIKDVIQFPNFDGGSYAFNTENPFIFGTDPYISEMEIPFTLTITANEDSEYPYETSFDFKVDLSLQKAGWPLTLEGSSTSPALIKDINGDGLNEIIFGDSRGNLYVVSEDKNHLPGFPKNLSTNINSGIAAADLNNNGRVELVVNTLAGIISCLDYQGEVLFQYNMEGQLRTNPMLVDVNNNGNYEIVSLSFTNHKLVILERTGEELEGFPIDLESSVMSSPAAADLNGDGNREIIFGTSAGYLHAISAITGEDIEGFPIDMGGATWNGITVGDFTGNNKPEIAVATVRGDVFVYDNAGTIVLHREGSPVRSGVLVFDINNNGQRELVYGDTTGRLFVIDNNGDILEGFPVNVGSTIESTPVLADITRDGSFEMIFGDSRGNLHSINAFGEHTPNFPLKLNDPFSVSPTIGFVGESSNAGILIPNQSGYQYVDYKRDIGVIAWPMFKGNAQRTGNAFDITTSVDESITLPQLQTKLKPNYPNPFNPNTTISFTVGKENAWSSVNITVYNIRGQAISTLVNDSYEPGTYSVNWDGRNDQGVEVGSGVYFYRMKTKTSDDIITETRKMMLVK